MGARGALVLLVGFSLLASPVGMMHEHFGGGRNDLGRNGYAILDYTTDRGLDVVLVADTEAVTDPWFGPYAQDPSTSQLNLPLRRSHSVQDLEALRPYTFRGHAPPGSPLADLFELEEPVREWRLEYRAHDLDNSIKLTLNRTGNRPDWFATCPRSDGMAPARQLFFWEGQAPGGEALLQGYQFCLDDFCGKNQPFSTGRHIGLPDATGFITTQLDASRGEPALLVAQQLSFEATEGTQFCTLYPYGSPVLPRDAIPDMGVGVAISQGDRQVLVNLTMGLSVKPAEVNRVVLDLPRDVEVLLGDLPTEVMPLGELAFQAAQFTPTVIESQQRVVVEWDGSAPELANLTLVRFVIQRVLSPPSCDPISGNVTTLLCSGGACSAVWDEVKFDLEPIRPNDCTPCTACQYFHPTSRGGKVYRCYESGQVFYRTDITEGRSSSCE